MIVKTKYLSSEGIPNLFGRKDCVFVIGDKSLLQDIVLETLDKLKGKGLWYDLYIHNSIGKASLADYIGGDVICPLFDINGYIRGYIVADSSEAELPVVVEDTIKATYKNQREYLEDILLAATFNSPVEFNNSVDAIFGEHQNRDNDSDGNSRFLPFDISGFPLLPLGTAAFGLEGDFDLDFDVADGIDDISIDESIDLSDAAVGPIRYLNTSNMSSKNKREFLKHIPEKVSERYIRKNPNCKKDLEALIASVSHEDLQQLVLELITRQKGATRIFDFSNLSAASEYELYVRKWDKSIQGFDQKFHYCIFLKDGRGKEYPIKFQHHPAYCLYMMYIIDRAMRGNDASYLSIRENKEQYIQLYQTVFGDPYDEAEKKYLTFAYRLTKEGVISRKGRYDDYLKDIDNTITSIVGRADSIPLKLRDGGHIELLPERINIDENLRVFHFK